MKIGILSDIHENFGNLNRALEMCKAMGVERLLCLGDLINPGVVRVLAHCGLPCHFIWGNNDGDKVLITKLALAADSQLTLSDRTYDFVEIDGRKIFMTHYDDLAQPMAHSGLYDVVLYGHNHQKFAGSAGNCLILNPGELFGYLTGIASFAIYDTAAHTAEHHLVG